MENQELDNDMLSLHQAPAQKQAQSNKAPFMTLTMFPGFKCFFRQPTLKEQIPYHECYERVMQSHFQLSKIRMPLEAVLQNKQLDVGQKSRLIYARTAADERNYIQSEGGDIVKYHLGSDKQKMIEQLKKQLQLYRRSAEEALVEKRGQFKKIRQEQDRARMRVEEQKRRRAEVIERLQKQYAQRQFKRLIDTNTDINL